MKPAFFATILALLLFVSCGKSESTQSVKLRIVSAAMFSEIPNAGGVLVVGRTLDDKNSFSKSITSDTDMIDLPKGTWEFFAIAWEGNAAVAVNKNLTGAHRCGYSGIVKIDKEDTAVTFTMSQAGCSQAVSDGTFVADPIFMMNNQFKNFSFVDCSSVPSSLDPSSCSSTNRGRSKSFRIRFPDVLEIDGVKKHLGGGLTSRCIEESSYYSLYNYLTLPVGTVNNGFAGFIIESFDGTSCTGNILVSKYSHNQAGSHHAMVLENGSSPYLFFPHFNPYNSLGYDDSSFSGNVVFNTCHSFTIKLKDLNGNVVAVDQPTSGTIYSSNKLLFYPTSTCDVGTGSVSRTFTLSPGQSSTQVFFKAFSSTANFYADISSLGIGFNYNKAVDNTTFNYATLTVGQLKAIAEAAGTDSSIANAHTTLSTDSVVVLRYETIISKIRVVSISASFVSFDFETYDYTTGSLLASSGSTVNLSSSTTQICDLTDSTCNVISYTGSDPGYHLAYNNINYLNLYANGTDRALFYFQ